MPNLGLRHLLPIIVVFYNSDSTLLLVYVHVVTKTVLFDALTPFEYNSAFIRNNYDS